MTAGDSATTLLRNGIVAQALVQAGGSAGGYVWARLEHPVALEPLTEYYVASFEQSGGDTCLPSGTVNYNANAGTNTAAQLLFDYPGAAPLVIGTAGSEFKADSTGYSSDANGVWQLNSGISAGGS